MMSSKLLIIGPSFKRKDEKELMPAIDRYDGVFYRVTRKNLHDENVIILIQTEDLKLIKSSDKIPYLKPKGEIWSQSNKINYSEKHVKQMIKENSNLINNTIKDNNICEIFVAVGANFRKALPDLNYFNGDIIYPSGGLGPTAKLLKEWLRR
jgi:hypothetical protein